MHELGIMYHVVKQVEAVAGQNNLTQIESLVLQIGEMASVVPQFIRACYPAAVDGTLLQNTLLEIEILPANARCEECGKVYGLLANPGCCPHCGGQQKELLSGREFNIKEIRAC
ncbi:MAG: hydrogenase maturation nickel metallochaperone HypA [Oscillospiraceae bacterium]